MITFKFRIEYVLLALVIIACLPSVAAFGAGDIPDFAFLEGKAFRHGDIEAILEQLYKNSGKSGGFGGGLLGVAVGVASAIASGGRGQKFSKSDVKRVYFGNWLRDYSQAMDIAGLSKLTAQSLVTVVSVLGFLEFGYATEEYQVTAERLGVYLPIEHIDNPKGYAEKEGDARQFHQSLRPPVDPRELEIDPNNGMKKYMATENQGWDTSTALIRRTLKSCIQHARQSGGNNGPELYEAYRLLGTALHTLEDLLAHSNWCELTLLKMGHNVFCHVGDNVKVNTPSGQAPPLVTGTFGGADFLHSLLGESQDHLSESSISDLSSRMAKAKQDDQQQSKIDVVKGLLGKVPSSGGQDSNFQKPEQIKANAVNLDIDKVAPEELQKQLWDALVWRDGVMRNITKVIENIPGLEALVEELNMALMEYVFTVIEPWLSPLLIKTTGVLKEGSEAVIDTNDQYQVWDNANASDPSHSFLSKDHFGLALNEPAGKVAKVVVEHTVNVIVGTWWDQNKDVDQAINKVLEAFHHPYYATGSSEIQNAMYESFNKWFGGLGSDQREIINRLSAQNVRDSKNVRIGSEDNTSIGAGHSKPRTGGYQQPSQSQQTYGSSGGAYGSSQQQSYGQSKTNTTSSYGQSKASGYGGGASGGSYNRGDNTDSYGQSRNTESSGYGGGYGSTKHEESAGYGGGAYGSSKKTETTGYGASGGYGSAKKTETSGYGGGYGSTRRDDDEPSGGYGGYKATRKDDDEYGSTKKESSGYGGGYGSTRKDDDEYGSSKKTSSGYGGTYGSSRADDNKPSGGYGGYKSTKNDDDEYGSSKKSSSGYGARDDNKPSGGYGGYKSTTKDDDDEYGSSKKSSSGYGGGYGSTNQPSGGYGGYKSTTKDDDEYGSSKKSSSGYGGSYGTTRRDDDDSGGYGSRRKDDNERGSGGYGSSRRNDDDDNKPSGGYSRGGGGTGHSAGGYGGSRKTDESESYGGGGRHRKSEDETSGGYGGGYGGGRPAGGFGRQTDETFGAERLNINEGSGYGGGRKPKHHDDDDDDDDKRSGGYGRKKKHGGDDDD